jgi:putative tryptophan/tyrosine transport system substrate-binding protein
LAVPAHYLYERSAGRWLLDRRAFLRAAAAGLFTAPHAAEAQPAGKVWRVGYLGNGNPTTSAHTRDAFRQGLRELGWVEDQNISIEYRWADGHLDRFPALAAELLGTRVDLLLVAGRAAVRGARQATRSVPIVSAITGDPVTAGFAASLARP